ncbi:MAG: acylneuraminate cytidylyltransferase family protein [Lachnospiraceae bacterium]|nr:acylneuraminate cytidylyltransferase family protein [Lachnospiraceae bacterium]
MNILFTICGRAGSKGFKNKNLKELNGVPLVFYTLAVIFLYQEGNPEDKIEVAINTDSHELINLVLKQDIINNIQIIERQKELAGDTVPKVLVIQDTFMKCKQPDNYDIVIDLDITSPLRCVQDIEDVIKEFKKNKYDVVFSVVKARRSPYFNMVEKRGEYYRKICQSSYTARQQAPKVYELNASIYGYNPEFLTDKIEKTILDYRCGIVEMNDYLVLDIDSEEDLELMEELVPILIKRDQGLKELLSFLKKYRYGKN